MTGSIPIVETSRLVLRGYRLEDFTSCAAMWADPIVTRFIGGNPLTVEEAWGRLLRYAGHWALLGFGYWAIEEKATGACIGELGFADWKRQIEPAIGLPEAGWVLATAAQGKGYATEALLAALDWARLHLAASQTACLIHPDNRASIRVATKVGYHDMLHTTYRGQPAIVFRR